jgi:hypothetical protein
VKKNSELVWEFSVAWIAFAGGATLLANYFPFIPTYVFGLLFVAGFIFMLVSFGIRLYENQNPVIIDWAILCINTLEDTPSFDITMGFIAREKTNIDNHIFIEFPKELDTKIRQIASIESLCALKEPWDNFVPIDAGQYLEFSPKIAFNLLPSCDKTAINSIDFSHTKIKLRWSVIGQRHKYTKLDIVRI